MSPCMFCGEMHIGACPKLLVQRQAARFAGKGEVMAIDPRGVREGYCLNCGRDESWHVVIIDSAGRTHKLCANESRVFVPKPSAPKAKPGVVYRYNGIGMFRCDDRIGLADGTLGFTLGKSGITAIPMTTDWQEVE